MLGQCSACDLHPRPFERFFEAESVSSGWPHTCHPLTSVSKWLRLQASAAVPSLLSFQKPSRGAHLVSPRLTLGAARLPQSLVLLGSIHRHLSISFQSSSIQLWVDFLHVPEI